MEKHLINLINFRRKCVFLFFLSEGITCGDFITILEGKKSTPNMEMTSDDTEQTEVKQLVTEVDPLHEFDNDIPLEKFHCVGILSKWIQKSKENDFESFIGKMKAYESKQATGKSCFIDIFLKILSFR